MDQFIVSIESPGMPGYAYQTTIATEAQVEDLKVAAEHYGLKVIVHRPAAVGTVLQWMANATQTGEEMSTYRKKPVEIQAWRVRDLNHAAANDWSVLPATIQAAYELGGWVFGAESEDGRRGIYVPTLEGSLFAAPDDWIIQGVKGEFYPCKPDIFEATYDEVAA